RFYDLLEKPKGKWGIVLRRLARRTDSIRLILRQRSSLTRPCWRNFRRVTVTSPTCRPKSATKLNATCLASTAPISTPSIPKAKPGSRAENYSDPCQGWLTCPEVQFSSQVVARKETTGGTPCRFPTNSTCSTSSTFCASSVPSSSFLTSSARSQCRPRSNFSSRRASSHPQPGCISPGLSKLFSASDCFLASTCSMSLLSPSSICWLQALPPTKSPKAGSG